MPESRLERTRKAYEEFYFGWTGMARCPSWKDKNTVVIPSNSLYLTIPVGWTGTVQYPDRAVEYVNGSVVK